ncbi:MAG: DMT family transporter [Acidimicrobiia bacterium]
MTQIETLSAESGPSDARVSVVMVGVVVLFGLGAPITKLISAPPVAVTSVRLWLAAPLLLAIAAVSGQRVTLGAVRHSAAAGVYLAANLTLVFVALQHVSVAVVSMITALQPGIVIVVAGRWMGELSNGWHKAWTAVAVVGVGIVVVGGDPEIAGDGIGVVFAVLALFTFIGYHLCSRRARSSISMGPVAWLAGVILCAAIATTPVALVTSTPDDYRRVAGADWLYIAFMVVVVGIFGHGAMSWAHKYVSATRSSLFLLGMNVVAIAASWPIHDEPISLVQAIGCVVVLVAVSAVLSRPGNVVAPSPVGDIIG